MTARVYYNENDPQAVAWLHELMKAGAIPQGHVDARSIKDVQPKDLLGFDQCHFFAGIGGWSEALRLANYAHVKGLWTGSCPCQPFSAAGKRKGISDARHLWPEMFRLVKACKPQYVIGEQVEAAVRAGWLDGVFGDLEGEGYACGAAVLGAHSVGAPHIRQRLYWGGARRMEITEGNRGDGPLQPVQREEVPRVVASGGRDSSGLEHTPNERCHERRGPEAAEIQGGRSIGSGEPALEGQGGVVSGRSEGLGADTGSGLGNPDDPRPQGYGVSGERAGELSPWAASTTIYCADGKTRRISVEPALFPLAHGVPGRVGLLRGAGNAIVPQVAATFIEAFVESLDITLT